METHIDENPEDRQSIATTARIVQAIKLETTNRVVLKLEMVKLSSKLVVVMFWTSMSNPEPSSSVDRYL